MTSLLASILGYSSSSAASTESKNDDMVSHQLIKFDSNEKAQLNIKKIWNNKNINDDSFFVISIIGDARKGKSTFFNCMISYLLNTNIEVFKASNQQETLTHGITMYICKNIIFLDCEGLGKEGTQRDIKLLLIPYMISNVVIFNDSDDFNDSLIKKLEPLTTLSTFVDYGKKINKPKLIFRISNYNLEGDIKESFKNKMKTSKDKDVAKTIMKTLNELFENIDILSTPSPDRSERILLTNKQYLEFINNELTQFKIAINYILDIIKDSQTLQFSNLITMIEQSVNSINTNENIKPEYFDTTRIIHEKFIDGFISQISKDIYEEIIIDGLKTSHNLITTRQNKLEELLKKYDNNFAKVEHDIKNEHRDKIKNKIQNKIDLAIKKSNAIVENVYKNQLELINFELANTVKNEINKSNLHSFCDFDFEQTILNQTITNYINVLDKYQYGNQFKINTTKELNELIECCKNRFNKLWNKNLDSVKTINNILDSWNENKIIDFIISNDDNINCCETFDNNILEPLLNAILNDISNIKFHKLFIKNLQILKFEIVKGELKDNFNFNDYIQYVKKYRNQFIKTDKISETYNNIVINKIKIYSSVNPFNKAIIENNPSITMFYIDYTEHPEWKEHNGRLINVYNIFDKKAKIYFEDEIKNIAEINKICFDHIMIFSRIINSYKSFVIDLGYYEKNMITAEYIIRRISDTLELNSLNNL